jgi:hypothetical protein
MIVLGQPLQQHSYYIRRAIRSRKLQKNYCRKRKILQEIQNSDTLQQRQNFSVNHEEQVVSDFPSRFDFNKNCFLCGNSDDILSLQKS